MPVSVFNSNCLKSPFALNTGAVVMLLSTLGACHQQVATPSLAPPLPVQTFTVTPGFDETIQKFPVTLLRDREANLSFRVGGVIQSVNFKPGQLVTKGQLLAEITPINYEAAKARSNAEYQKILRANQRNQELIAAGAITNSLKEDTQDNLAAAKANLEGSEYDLSSTAIKAPFSGVILSLDSEFGETVSPGQRIIKMADLESALIAKAAIPLAFAKRIHTGDVAMIRLGVEAQAIPAKVRFIGASSDPKTAAVMVDLVVNTPQRIPSGSTGSVEFHSKNSAGSPKDLKLPPGALLESNQDKGHVFVLDPKDSTAHKQEIKVLGIEGEWIRVSGLESGAKVITTGAGFVTEGQKVQESLR